MLAANKVRSNWADWQAIRSALLLTDACHKSFCMPAKELMLLSPHRFPTDTSPILGSEEIACFMHGWSSLWHPAALLGAPEPPRVASPYDHENPVAGAIYALPENPSLVLPDDWQQRLVNVGAFSYQASSDRTQTLTNLREAVNRANGNSALWDLPTDKLASFFALGYGFAVINSLFEAMQHENVLAVADFWNQVQQAAAAAASGDHLSMEQALRAAGECLRSAREVVYPVEIYWLDLCLLGEKPDERLLPQSLEYKVPLSILSTASTCELLKQDQPQAFDDLRAAVEAETSDICGGLYVEHDDAELSLESQIWNLRRGQATYKRLFGRSVPIFSRRRFGMHPLTPSLLQVAGIQQAVLVAFDDAVIPTYRGTVVNWPAPDGKQVVSFTRTPLGAEEPSTFFHLAAHLRRTIADDHSATLALVHRKQPAAPAYADLLELSKLGSVLGNWFTLSRYLSDVMASEYASASTADDFRGDTLARRVDGHEPFPQSYFANHARGRRRLDSIRIVGGLLRGLAGSADTLHQEASLAEIEDRFEETGSLDAAIAAFERTTMEAMAERLLSRATGSTPGRLLINPCSYARRVNLELPHTGQPLALGGPLKAAQFSDGRSRLVVEVPGMGFAWIPRSGPANTAAPAVRMKLADERCVRNEFFEAEVDPATGGLRAFRDQRTRANRLGQQLVYNPGSSMKARSIRVTCAGSALGELLSEGDILAPDGAVLATFRQRLRAWLGRPLLEMRVEITPTEPPKGYSWHAYYAARFAWRDERSLLVRGAIGPGYVSTATHPETPDYLEVRTGSSNVLILPGGLPFHQRQGVRMLDVLLMSEGESVQTFDLGLALDRNVPMQTAQAMVTPVQVLDVAKGPPHIGDLGWLFHLDATNLMLTSLEAAPEGADAVVVRLVETHLQGGQAELRCPRNPQRAQIVDLLGNSVMEARIDGDSVGFDFAPAELINLRIEFS
jgi:hypothetical protein